MLLPIDASKITIILIGDPIPQFVYGTKERRKNAQGQDIFKLPVLISGTTERQDPTTSITIAGTLPRLEKGSRLNCSGLTVSSWTMKGSDGQTRNGISLRANTVTMASDKI